MNKSDKRDYKRSGKKKSPKTTDKQGQNFLMEKSQSL